MDGEVGDRLIVHGRKVGQRTCEGEIVEVLTNNGRHYRVRWSDGHESMTYPGTDVTIVPMTDRATVEPTWTRSMVIDLRLAEDAEHCTATATMMTAGGTFTGNGTARRHPNDPDVPMIGEELAVSRCLADLAVSLEQAATRTMNRGEHPTEHLIAP